MLVRKVRNQNKVGKIILLPTEVDVVRRSGVSLEEYVKQMLIEIAKKENGNGFLIRRRTMLERIRTFFGRTKGTHQDKTTIVAQGTAWYCTECRLVFITKEAGEQHKCQDQRVN